MGHHKHDAYLDELVFRLTEIDENPRKIQWIMKDGIWLKDDSLAYYKMCDLLLAYQDYIIPVELKGSKKKRTNAIEQIISGAEFARQVLHYTVPYGKFVVYGNQGYTTEKIRLK